MLDVVSVDRLEVLVVVDNATDSLSSNPPNVIPEWTGLLTGGRMRVVAGACICCAHHGLSLLITAHGGGEKHTVLFDAGPEGEIFHRNARILGIDFADDLDTGDILDHAGEKLPQCRRVLDQHNPDSRQRLPHDVSSGDVLGDQTVADGVGRQFGIAVYAQLFKQTSPIGADGLHAEVQGMPDLGHGFAARETQEYLHFALGQGLVRRAAGAPSRWTQASRRA